jgi:hypothetical protein
VLVCVSDGPCSPGARSKAARSGGRDFLGLALCSLLFLSFFASLLTLHFAGGSFGSVRLVLRRGYCNWDLQAGWAAGENGVREQSVGRERRVDGANILIWIPISTLTRDGVPWPSQGTVLTPVRGGGGTSRAP